MSALQRGLLELGLEGFIPLWQIRESSEVRKESGVSPSIEEISMALTDLLKAGQIFVLVGHWSEEPDLVYGNAAASLLRDPRRYSSAEEIHHELDRVYFVNKDQWRPSADAAWLLLALDSAGRQERPDLSAVVGAADAVNHAVMTYREFQTATAVLIAAGLAKPPEGLQLTEEGNDLLKRHRASTWHERWIALRDALGKAERPDPPRTSVNESDFNRAVTEYLSRRA